MPLVERGEDGGASNSSDASASLRHRLQLALEAGCKGCGIVRWRRGGPGEDGCGYGEVDITSDVGAGVPLGEKAVEEEGGFPDAAGPVEEKRLGDAEMVGEVVEDGLEDGARDDPPRMASGGEGGGEGGGGKRRRPRHRSKVLISLGF